tara:strand:+ start:189 stop:695 length:507 start_codon:yes stop_codon:yes gene_type:complete
MSLENRTRDLGIRIATEINTLRTEGSNRSGLLAALTTTDKSNLVAAINELAASIGSASGINDAVTSLSSSWSSTKTASEITTAINALVSTAPSALDTLAELAAAIEGNDGDITAILTAQGSRVRTDTAVQGLDVTQQSNARTNIGAVSATDVGNTERDFVADFVGGLT